MPESGTGRLQCPGQECAQGQVAGEVCSLPGQQLPQASCPGQPFLVPPAPSTHPQELLALSCLALVPAQLAPWSGLSGASSWAGGFALLSQEFCADAHRPSCALIM